MKDGGLMMRENTQLKVKFPLSLRIAVVFTILIFLSLGIIGVLSYRKIISGSIEPLIGKRLDFTVRGIALRISGESYLKIAEILQKDPSHFATQPDVKEIHHLLILAQRQNELSSDIQIFSKDPSHPDRMILVMTSNEDLKVGGNLPMDPYVESVFKQELPLFTPIFKRDGVHWISGLTTIETQKGSTVAVLRVDYPVDQEIQAAKLGVIRTLAFAGLLAFILASALGVLLGRSLSKPVKILANAAKEVSGGNLQPQLDLKSKDEIGFLASAFVEMLSEMRRSRAKLESYSKELEQKVKERTADLNDANQKISAMLDSLGQGFFMFDSSGLCLSIHSKACLQLLEQNPQGMKLADYLRGETAQIEQWVKLLFQESLPFQDLVPIGPKIFAHSKGRVIELSYQPVRSEDNKILYVIVIATDKTSEVEAKRVAELERGFSKLVLSIADNREQFVEFLKESKSVLLEIKKARLKLVPSSVSVLMRGLHTIKGGAALFHLKNIKDLAHHHESLLNELKQKKEISEKELTEFDVGIEAIEREYAEVIHRFRPLIGAGFESGEAKVTVNESELLDFYKTLTALESENSELPQVFSRSFLQEPLEKLFKYYNEVVTQAAENLGKLVEPIFFEGGDTKLDPRPFRKLFGSFIHAFRNAVDHGLETPEERIEAGKTDVGHIQVTFRIHEKNSRNWLEISVRDDGRGIDSEKVRKKLKSLNPKHPLLSAEDSELIQVLFESGFSTREQVTDWSGRGVGMDAILSEAKRLGGTARIHSQLGKGSTLNVLVPLQVT